MASKLLQPVQYIGNPRFRRTAVAIDALGRSPLPTLPPIYDPEPWRGRRHQKVTTHVMTREEERARFLEYNFAKFMASKTEQTKARQEWLARAEHLREYLVRLNMPLIYSQVARNLCRYRKLDWDEGIHLGSQPLMNAVDKFNVENGAKFSTYACRAILNSLSRGNHIAAKKANREKGTEHVDDFGQMVDIGDPLAEAKEALADVLEQNRLDLTGPEKYVLVRRYGLDGEPRSTLEEIGEVIGVTKERVRQVQNKIVARLREVIAA